MSEYGPDLTLPQSRAEVLEFVRVELPGRLTEVLNAPDLTRLEKTHLLATVRDAIDDALVALGAPQRPSAATMVGSPPPVRTGTPSGTSHEDRRLQKLASHRRPPTLRPGELPPGIPDRR